MKGDLQSAVSELRTDESIRIVTVSLGDGVDASQLLQESRDAIEQIMQRYERREILQDSVTVAASICKSIRLRLEPHMRDDGSSYIGSLVIGTVRDDIHDQGKNMVADLLAAVGFSVHDLGVNVRAEEFVTALRQTQAPILCLAGLVPSCFDSMKETVEAVRGAGLAPKVVIGGGIVDERLRKYVGADAQTHDMVEGARICLGFISGTTTDPKGTK